MTKTTKEIFSELEVHLGDEKIDMGEMLADIALGMELLNPVTKRLVRELFDSMPESDNLTIDQIADRIYEIGTPFAQGVAQDIRIAGAELD